MLLRVFSNQTPQAILDANTDFIDQIGLKEHLSPTRANGLLSMVKQIKLYASGISKIGLHFFEKFMENRKSKSEISFIFALI